MDYKKAIRTVIERRQKALDIAENTYDTLINKVEVLSALDKEKRRFAFLGDDENYNKSKREVCLSALHNGNGRVRRNNTPSWRKSRGGYG